MWDLLTTIGIWPFVFWNCNAVEWSVSSSCGGTMLVCESASGCKVFAGGIYIITTLNCLCAFFLDFDALYEEHYMEWVLELWLIQYLVFFFWSSSLTLESGSFFVLWKTALQIGLHALVHQGNFHFTYQGEEWVGVLFWECNYIASDLFLNC